MHGLVNRAVERFIRDTYGRDTWMQVVRLSGSDVTEFEAMLTYDDAVTLGLLEAASDILARPVSDVLEDIGTYLVSHPNVEALRRLLRFGGSTFTEFLHSLDDLPARARLAVADLELPELDLREHTATSFSLACRARHPGFGHVIVGLLRALADDYGALVVLDHKGVRGDTEIIEIHVSNIAYATGRDFDLGARAG